MKTKLQNIATIQSGIFAKPVSKGDVVYLKAKHFDESGKLKARLQPDIYINSISNKHLLNPGDLVFTAKGTKNVTAVYESKNLPAVASTSFFTIRINYEWVDKILPEFLAWFLNHPSTQKYLKGKAKGTAIVSIAKSTIQELQVPIPPPQVQRAVLEIHSLRKIEIQLKEKIESLREKQIQQIILNGIK